MSRIVLVHGTAYYEKLSVSGYKTMITNKNWIELVRENEKLPLEINKGELVRTFIIPADTDTQIMLMAHHLVGDGKSIIYLIRDIMNALAERPLTYKPLALFNKIIFWTQVCRCSQNYMPIIADVSGKIAFLYGRTTIIYIISIGKQLVPIYNIKRCLLQIDSL